MAAKFPEILIFLGRGEIFFFEPKSGYAKTLPVPETAVKDLEVIDANVFGSWIGSFLDKEKLAPGNTLIVISEAISFTRDIPFSEGNKKEILVQDFTDTVPLESPEVKVFRTGELNKAVAVNSEYFQVVVEMLTGRGFNVAGVVPGSVISEVGPAATITLEIASKVLTNFDKFKFQNFIDVSAVNTQVVGQSVITTGKPKGSRIYILAGVFVVGTIILIYLLTAGFR